MDSESISSNYDVNTIVSLLLLADSCFESIQLPRELVLLQLYNSCLRKNQAQRSEQSIGKSYIPCFYRTSYIKPQYTSNYPQETRVVDWNQKVFSGFPRATKDETGCGKTLTCSTGSRVLFGMSATTTSYRIFNFTKIHSRSQSLIIRSEFLSTLLLLL